MVSVSALVQVLTQKEIVFSGWSMWPSSIVVESLARSFFDTVLIDMQHGLIGYSDAMAMTAAITHAGKPAMVRIPVGDFATASRALDSGAQGIVAPMINTATDAQAFVDAVKYPPLGQRSYGPFRACQLFDIAEANDYVAQGNRSCLAFAMIETEEAIENLDNILAVEGLDGVFVGPADMSLTLLGKGRVDMHDAHVNDIYAQVADKARAAGLYAGIYSPDADFAKRFASYGYQLIAVGSDVGFMKKGLEVCEQDLLAP